MATHTYTFGGRQFVLDVEKAERAIAEKRVINGRITMAFNLLPLKYPWAYDLYRTMKANHWEPEDIPMNKDVAQWRSNEISDLDRWITELAVVLGRHAHEENVHADSLLYMISSLGIDPYECEAMFVDIPSIRAKNAFVTQVSHALRRDLDLTQVENKQLLAKNIFTFGLIMEGTQFYGLFGMVLSLYRQGKFPGIGQMFRYTLRDESNHIELFRRLLLELVKENPEIWTPDFQSELRALMAEGVRLEEEFISDCLPLPAVGLKPEEFIEYIHYIANRRLQSVGLEPLYPGARNTLPWLAELMDIRKEQNFFEGRVTEYRKASALAVVSDDEL